MVPSILSISVISRAWCLVLESRDCISEVGIGSGPVYSSRISPGVVRSFSRATEGTGEVTSTRQVFSGGHMAFFLVVSLCGDVGQVLFVVRRVEYWFVASLSSVWFVNCRLNVFIFI